MSDDALIEQLTEIPQVGEARAETIIETVREHDQEHSDAGDLADVDELRDQLDDALDHLDADQPGHASKFVRRAREQLED